MEHARRYRTLAKLSAVVLIIGLAVELSAHRRVIELSAEETVESDRQLGQTFKAAGAAIGRASEADERAKTVEGHNKQLGIDLEAEKAKSANAQRFLSKQLADEKERSGNLQVQLGKLNIDAEALKGKNLALESEVLKLREKMTWRRLTPEQQQSISSALRRFSGERLNVFVYSGDAEILSIRNDILFALSRENPASAGWIVTVSSGQEFERAISGILVEISGIAEAITRPADVLVSTFTAEGLVVNGPFIGHWRRNGGTVLGEVIAQGPVDALAEIRMTIGRRP